jgi:hypothetical protein
MIVIICKRWLAPETMYVIRNSIKKQAEDGIIVLPPGFTCMEYSDTTDKNVEVIFTKSPIKKTIGLKEKFRKLKIINWIINNSKKCYAKFIICRSKLRKNKEV